MSLIKFNINFARELYGGSLNGLPHFKTLHENVTEDFILGFLQGLPPLEARNGRFYTEADEMGCFDVYEFAVSQLPTKKER